MEAGSPAKELCAHPLVQLRELLQVPEDLTVPPAHLPRRAVEHHRGEVAHPPVIARLEDVGSHRVGVAEDHRLDRDAELALDLEQHLDHREAGPDRAAAAVDVHGDPAVGDSRQEGVAPAHRLEQKRSASALSMSLNR